jgi:hypothetical protein
MAAANTVELTLQGTDKGASSAIKEVIGDLTRMQGMLLGMAGLAVGAGGLGALIKQGIDFNKTMEYSKGGIAGVLLMTREYTGANSELLKGQKAMNAAFSEASTIQEKLKKDALGTAASYTELVQAFQSSVGPATKAGVESLDDIREITVMATQAMSALGIPTAQAAQELRGLFAGDMGPDNRLNQVLGVTKADLNAVAGDAEAVAKLFKDRLGPAAATAAMQTGTLTVRLSNLGDIVDQTMGKATEGVFRDISSGVADLIAWVEKIGPKAEEAGTAMWTAFKATLGPIQEIARLTFAAIDSRARESGGTWTEVLQGFAVVVNNVAYFIRLGWAAMFEGLLHPLDLLRTLFGTTMRSILGMVADVAEKIPTVLGGGAALAEQIRAAADAVDAWGSKDNKWLSETAEAQARALSAWQENEKAILNIGSATKKVSSDPTSNPKDLLNSGAGAALHFGQAWGGETAKAFALLGKFTEGFASFTGDTVGEAVAKIEIEYTKLIGELGQLMFLAKVPFEEGLAMLEQLAKEKGKKITGAIFNGEAAVEDFISLFDAKLTRDNVAVGIAMGLRASFDAIPKAAESAANAVQGVWQGMARAFDDSFYSVLTGRLDSLKDVFKNLWDSLLRTFSQYLSDMLQRWIATQMQMQSTAAGAGGIASSQDWANYTGAPSAGSGSGWGGAVAGGITGAGIGYGVGQFGNGQYNSAGATIGGAIGGIALAGVGAKIGASILGVVIPGVGIIIGALIGAIAGLIVGMILSPSTLMHVKGTIGGMVGATRWDKVPIYESFPGGASNGVGIRDGAFNQVPGEDGTGGNVAPPGIIGWETVASQEFAKTALELSGKRVFDSLEASLAGVFKLAGGDSRGLLDIYRAQLKGDLSGANFDINAGSDETIQKTAEYLVGDLLPRLGLSAAFGQTGYLPVGNQDKGGVGNLSYGVAGMNADGTWMKKQLFDPEAAIPTMLRGLGFTQDKIGELAARISTDDPKKLLEYIGGIVGVVVGLKKLGAEMGKTFTEIRAGWDEEAAAGPAAAFAKQAQSIADLFGELDLYSGDEQLKKAQEAQAASAQFWESVQSYLQQLDALAEKLSAGLQGMREKMRSFLNPLSEAGAGAANQSIIDGVWGKLLTATNPGQIESATNEAAAAIEALFNVMAERVTRGKALIERLTKLDQGLWDIGKGADDGPLAAMAQDMVDIQRKVADAARLTGLEQIAAMEDVAGSAEDMFGKLKGLLSEIASVSESINKSIDSQIWELGVGEMDPAGQATAITQRIKELQDQLKIATSPAEIQAITSEIQSLTGRYVGQFGKDDPNRAEAIAWAQQELERTRGLANETLELMRKQAEEYAKGLQDLIKGSVTTISTNVDEASAAIGQLSQTLSEIDRVVREQLERLGTAALDALEPLRTAMEGAAGIFTGATGAAAEGLTGEPGFNASTDRAAARLEIFANVVDRAAANLERLANAGTGKSPAPAAAKVSAKAPESRISASEVIPMVRRYAGHLTPRVG